MVRRMAHSPAAIVSAVFGVSVRTARKRKKRYQQGGVEVLADRSSRSVRCRSKLTESIHGKVFALRKQRQTGDDIAASLGLSRSTVFASCTNLIAPASPLWRKNFLCDVINRKSPDKCFIWISSVWARLMAWDTERRERDKSLVAVPAGNICMSVWMMLPGQPVRAFTQTKLSNPPSSFCGVRFCLVCLLRHQD